MLRARRAGQNIVEFGLVISLLLTMVLGMIDFGRAMHTYVGLTNAAREGARRAAMLPVSSSCTGTDLQNVRDRVRNEQPGLWTGMTTATFNSMVTVTECTSDRRTVRIQNYPFVLVTPFIGAVVGVGNGPLPLTTWATMPTLSS